MRLRYWLTAPTVGEMLISLSLSRIDHARLALADVVERFQGETAHERCITDDDSDVLAAATQVTRQGQTLRDGDARAGMASVHDIVDALGAARKAADASAAAAACRSDRSGR